MATAHAEVESFKRAAAERAVELVRPGMIVGLGTGSTARYFIDGLGRKVGDGLKVLAVATSDESDRLARAAGIPIADRTAGELDLAVDGADEIDPALNCIKGRGGALLREKIVAHASRRFVLVADETKLVGRLGRGPLPVEILPFLWEATSRSIESLGGRPELRLAAGEPYRTDNGNLVLDTSFGIVDASLGLALRGIPGVIEHGLFFGLARAAIIGTASGIRVMGEL
jgi:ribose 5-phosphate isomerase A